jgi:hypothetical protein
MEFFLMQIVFIIILLNGDGYTEDRILLVFDLLSGKIDSPKLLSQINLSVPSYQTRGREFLFVEFHRTNYGIYEPINAAVRGFNEFAGLFDFNITRDTFLNRIKSVS